jgi:hypothetical protein
MTWFRLALGVWFRVNPNPCPSPSPTTSPSPNPDPNPNPNPSQVKFLAFTAGWGALGAARG